MYPNFDLSDILNSPRVDDMLQGGQPAAPAALPSASGNMARLQVADQAAASQPGPDRMQSALSIIAPLFAMGQALGGSARSGAAFLGGAHASLKDREQQQQIKAQRDQQNIIAQQRLQAQIAQQEAVRQAQQQARAMDLAKSFTAASATATTRADYEQAVRNFSGLASIAGVRIGPDELRQAAPYLPPEMPDLAYKALDAMIRNPINKPSLESGQILQTIVAIKDPETGQLIKLPFQKAVDLSNYPIAMTQSGVFLGEKGDKEMTGNAGVIYDDMVRIAKLEGREITPQAQAKMHKEAIRTAAEQAKIVVNTGGGGLGGGTVEQQVQTAAQSVLEHRLAPSQLATLFGGMGKEAQAFKRAVMTKVQEVDPAFNFQEAESGYQFGKSTGTQNTVRFLDNITQTMPRLRAASSDLKRGGVRVINQALLATGRQFGNTKVATFDTDRLILADEIAKVLQGGGTGSGTSDAKLQQAAELLRGDMSMGQFDATLNELDELLITRRGSLTKGTYMHKDAPQKTGGGPAIGSVVTLKDGRKMKVSGINPDGSITGTVVR